MNTECNFCYVAVLCLCPPSWQDCFISDVFVARWHLRYIFRCDSAVTRMGLPFDYLTASDRMKFCLYVTDYECVHVMTAGYLSVLCRPTSSMTSLLMVASIWTLHMLGVPVMENGHLPMLHHLLGTYFLTIYSCKLSVFWCKLQSHLHADCRVLVHWVH